MSSLIAALRLLRRQPGFTAAAIGIVGLGVGASTAVFSTVNGVLLRSLPYPTGDRVVHLTQPAVRNDGRDAAFSVTEIGAYDEASRSLDRVAEYHSMPFQIYGLDEPLRVQTGVVSAHFFDLFGVRPLHGRLFRPGEDAVGAHPVVVVSHKFFVEQFGADPSIVGKTFTMNDRTHEVVGVLPPLPTYPGQNDIWMPAGACPFRSSPFMTSTRGARMVQAYASIGAGSSVDAVNRELGAVQRRFQTEFPAAYQAGNPLEIRATPVMEELTSRARPILWTLLAMSGFLLVIATANFANLTLARQLRRSDEFALRAALGAGDRALLGQLVLESLAVTVPGGLLGAAIAAGSMGVLRTLAAGVTPRAAEIGLDPVVLAFALATSLVVGVAAAVAPFLKLRLGALASGSIAALVRSGTRSRLQDGLIALQLGVAVVVLVGAGLLTRSLVRLERVDRLADPERVASARIDLNWSRYRSNTSVTQFAENLMTRLENAPGIRAVAFASSFPLNATQGFRARLTVSRPAGDASAGASADLAAVGPRYFEILGVPMVAGRAFTGADRDSLAPPVIVSQGFAAASWPGGDPLTERISTDSGRTWHQVVGVVADVRQNDLTQPAPSMVYYPFVANPSSDFRILARTEAAPSALAPLLRTAVREIDQQQPVGEFRTVAEVRANRLTQPRLTTVLVVGFGAVALLLTGAGISGVVATSVGRRRKEIAVQKALGAPSSRVARHLLRPIAAMVVLGLGAGLGVAAAGSRLVKGLLFEIGATDPVTFIGVTVAVGLAAAVAASWPARAILRIDPARVLRGE